MSVRHASYDAVNLRSYISIQAANTSYIAWLLSTGKKAVIKKIMWINRTGGNGYLRVGYLTNAAVPVFTQVLPDIMMVNGIDGQLTEAELPLCGNRPEGFCADTTANTGTLGNIIIQGSVGGAPANDVMVTLEIEEN